MTRFYVLGDDGETVPCPDVRRWADWMRDNQDRWVLRKTELGGQLVSTVFLGTDHNFLGAGPPVLYETMIFGGAHDQYQERYVRREIAEARHEQLVADLRDGTFAPYDRRSSVAVIAARQVIREATGTRTPGSRRSAPPGPG